MIHKKQYLNKIILNKGLNKYQTGLQLVFDIVVQHRKDSLHLLSVFQNLSKIHVSLQQRQCSLNLSKLHFCCFGACSLCCSCFRTLVLDAYLEHSFCALTFLDQDLSQSLKTVMGIANICFACCDYRVFLPKPSVL